MLAGNGRILTICIFSFTDNGMPKRERLKLGQQTGPDLVNVVAGTAMEFAFYCILYALADALMTSHSKIVVFFRKVYARGGVWYNRGL